MTTSRAREDGRQPDGAPRAAEARTTERDLLAWAREVLEIEREAIEGLVARVDDSFVRAVRAIVDSSGPLFVCGVGKSGIVARKIAATFASTGTPAVFLHPAEAAHGDIGMVGRGKVVIAVSKSGEGEELLRILPVLRDLDTTIVAITGSTGSTLASQAEIVLDAAVEREACPIGIVPTASTTAALALGDALAVVVMKERGVDTERFAAYHPGGALGRRLLLTVRDVMHTGDEIPVVAGDASMQEAIYEIANKRLGLTTVVDVEGRLAGIVTDGDLKRILMKRKDILSARVDEVMTKRPRVVDADALVAEALESMEVGGASPITSLIVVDGAGRPAGVIHIHDCLKAVG